jgi:ABC-2 type transport system permease protein
MPAIMRRELLMYFRTPLAYLLAAIFCAILMFFATGVVDRGPGEVVPGLIWLSCFLLIFFIPILTMRLLAHETDTGAMEVLVTDPVTDWDIVLGKYLASVITILAMLSPLLAFVAVYAVSGKFQTGENELVAAPWYRFWVWLPAVLDLGRLLTGLLGLGLVVALFAAVGLFASSLTGNQAVSALVGIVANLVLWLFSFLTQLPYGEKFKEFIESVSPQGRLGPLVEGRLETRAIFLFVSAVALTLYFTVRAVESRKWR